MENETKKCPQCGCEVPNINTICSNCGYNFLKPQIMLKTITKGKSKIGNSSLIIGIVGLVFSFTGFGLVFALVGMCLGAYVLFSKKELHYGTAIAGVIISLFAFTISFGSLDEGNNSNNGKQVVESTKELGTTQSPKDKGKTVDQKKEKATATSAPKMKEWEKTYNNSEIRFVDLKYLSKNAKYFKGQIIISVSRIYEIGDSDIQFDTDDSNFFKEVTCQFKDNKEISSLAEKDSVCFIGEVSSIDTYFGNDTVTLKNCYIVAKGKEVSEYQKKIEKNKKQQKKFVSAAKKKQKKAKNKAAKQKKSSYMKKCESYSYKKIQRHPDKYKGKQIKLSGTVIQVMEGWFDSVSLRVEDASGNIWYINYDYSDKKAKILDNDKITVYGECTGTETYTTVLGSSQTIPSVDAQYIVRK